MKIHLDSLKTDIDSVEKDVLDNFVVPACAFEVAKNNFSCIESFHNQNANNLVITQTGNYREMFKAFGAIEKNRYGNDEIGDYDIHK